MLSIGTPLPNFSLINEQSEVITPGTWKGQWIVLYFYPKDNTPGCTTQACSFRDEYESIRALGAQIYGVSADSVKSHQKFITDQHLPFPLLVDSNHAMADMFETWVEKSMYGKKYMGMERSTYIINPEGVIIGAYQKVKPEGHAQFIAAELRKLQE